MKKLFLLLVLASALVSCGSSKYNSVYAKRAKKAGYGCPSQYVY